MPKNKPKKIWVDADACPKVVKEMIFKASQRLNIPTILVANSYQNIPCSPLIRLTLVNKGFDAADDHIVDEVEMYDLVITADIPLASKVLKKQAVALNPRGEIYTENNICSHLSVRDFLKEFRDAGTISGGPPAYNAKDLEKFANSLNKLLS